MRSARLSRGQETPGKQCDALSVRKDTKISIQTFESEPRVKGRGPDLSRSLGCVKNVSVSPIAGASMLPVHCVLHPRPRVQQVIDNLDNLSQYAFVSTKASPNKPNLRLQISSPLPYASEGFVAARFDGGLVRLLRSGRGSVAGKWTVVTWRSVESRVVEAAPL